MAATSPQPLREPLRLPRGSVRGGIALLVTITFAAVLLRTGLVPTVLVNAVIVVIAFYFGSAGARSDRPSASSPTTPSAPVPPIPRQPRFVRLLLFAGFLGLAGWFLWANRSLSGLPSELVQVWEVLGGYIAGAALAWLFHRHIHDRPERRRLALVFRDLSAAGAIALTAYICIAYLGNLTTPFADRTEDVLSLVVTYYFGSRVVAH